LQKLKLKSKVFNLRTVLFITADRQFLFFPVGVWLDKNSIMSFAVAALSCLLRKANEILTVIMAKK
jgi:hypothetical protein